MFTHLPCAVLLCRFVTVRYGIASLAPGTTEVMIHRRMNTSDSQGPWPLNDNTTVAETLWLLVDSGATSDSLQHRTRLALQYDMHRQ